MARRLSDAPVRVPGPAIRAHLIGRAAAASERWAHVPDSPWLHMLHVLEARRVPVSFKRWEVRQAWPDAQHGTPYYLDPDDTIREAAKDGDTWR